MSDSMETGGFGKNPTIDKINQLTLNDSRMNMVSELERKMFQTESPQVKTILCRRKQLIEEFHISFRRKEKKEDGDILQQAEPRMLAGQRYFHEHEDGYAKSRTRTTGWISEDGEGKTEPVLSADGTARCDSGE